MASYWSHFGQRERARCYLRRCVNYNLLKSGLCNSKINSEMSLMTSTMLMQLWLLRADIQLQFPEICLPFV